MGDTPQSKCKKKRGAKDLMRAEMTTAKNKARRIAKDQKRQAKKREKLAARTGA